MKIVDSTTYLPADLNTAPSGKQRILAEAHIHFSRRGYADVSMQEIAAAAGLTKAALYYHFESKELLFSEVFLEEMSRVCFAISQFLAEPTSLERQLEHIARHLLTTGNEGFGRLSEDLDRYLPPESRTVLLDRVPHPFVAIRPAFEQARCAGEIGPVNLDVSISLFFAAVFGQVRFAAYGGRLTAAPEELAKAVSAMVMHGIGEGARHPGDAT